MEGTVQLNSPHPEFFAAHPLCFPVAFWEPASWLFATFPSSGLLGVRPGSFLCSPTRLERSGWNYLMQHISPSPSVELCLLLGQGSSVKSPGWKPQSIQPVAASSRSSLLPPRRLPPRLFAGRAQSPVGDGLGRVFITPPPRGLHLLVHGGGGTPCGFLSLVGAARAWQTLTATAGCPLPGSVLPPWPQLVLHVPEPCTEPRLVLVPPSPFPTS